MSDHRHLELVEGQVLDDGELVECSRCRGFARSDEHILGPERRWTGYGPLPMMRYCTPYGVELRPLVPDPPADDVAWGWTAGGYRPIGEP